MSAYREPGDTTPKVPWRFPRPHPIWVRIWVAWTSIHVAYAFLGEDNWTPRALYGWIALGAALTLIVQAAIAFFAFLDIFTAKKD